MPDSLSVSSIPHPGASGVRTSDVSVRQPPILVRGAGLLACLDSLAAVAAILSVLISVSLPTSSVQLEDFLSARITAKNVLLLIFLTTAWPIVFHLFGLYDARNLRRIGSEAWRLLAATSAGSGLAFVFPLTSVSGAITFGDLQHFWLASLGLCLLVRTGRRGVAHWRQRHVRRVLIVGTGRLARRALRDLPHRYEVVGLVDEPTHDGLQFERVRQPTIGTLKQLEQILMHQVIDEVVIALPVKSCYEQIQYAIRVCEHAGVQAKYGVHLFESTVAFQRYDADGDRAFMAMDVAPGGYRVVVKRALDVVGAIVGLVIFAPLMLIVAIAVKLTSPGPIIYVQDRCGLNKRPLRMYKFRSMFVDADKLQASLEDRNEARGPVFKIQNDPRITPLGRWLRRSSLDELPQFWNVLRGDMSLVGPRPLPWRDVRRITKASDMRRFSMRPGMTCLWQIQGRSNLDFDRWVELDLEYIDTWSLNLDCRILVMTVPAVLTGYGAT